MRKKVATKRAMFAGRVLPLSPFLPWAAAHAPSKWIEVDYISLVTRADITCERPVERSQEGLLVGNDRRLRFSPSCDGKVFTEIK